MEHIFNVCAGGTRVAAKQPQITVASQTASVPPRLESSHMSQSTEETHWHM